jgi:hypothetical protein
VKPTLARFLQSLFVLCAAVCLPSPIAGRGNDFPDCLHAGSQAGQSSSDPGCHNDTLDVSGDATVRRAIEFLELQVTEIVFAECSNFPFTTSMPKTSRPYRFEIDYPTVSKSKVGDHLPAMLHELGHVYQYKVAGSPAKLFKMHEDSLEKAELGADFLAGLIEQKLNIDPGPFERSIFLPGNFRVNDHGRLEDRNAAFRNGYFYPLNKTTLDKAYQDFLDNRYSQIKNM